MYFAFGITLLYLASAIALGGLIKFSLDRPAARFIILGNFLIPILALYALTRALLPFGSEPVTDSTSPLSTDGLEEAEKEIEQKRQELFGQTSPLWVTRRFERRYQMYLEQSVRGLATLREFGTKKPA